MRLCLFEDAAVASLEPLTTTRPAFDLICGATTIAAKQCRHFAPRAVGALVRPHLADVCQLRHPATPVNDALWLLGGSVMFVNARWLPPPGRATPPAGPIVATIGETVVYCAVGTEQLTAWAPDALDDCLHSWKETLPRVEAGGTLIRYPWDLVNENPAQLRHDFARCSPIDVPAPVAVVGPRALVAIAPGARIDPMVVFDTTGGPIIIDRDAVVYPFSRIEGPCYVGPHAQVHGAKVRGGTTLGPHARVGGEVEASIVHGHSNKYHDGFLGHSYVGEWVNLGAGTQTSDLRNDYGEVTVVVGGLPVRTGLSKVGSFFGDHVKTALGTLLNTGTSVGCYCSLMPTGPLAPKYLPPFTTLWNGQIRENDDLEGLIQGAGVAVGRRGQTFRAADAALVRHLFAMTAPQRRRALRDAEQRRLRRSA